MKSKLPRSINIEFINHEEQLYDTVGNYQTLQGNWYITISKMKNWKYSFLVLLHELVEMALTLHHGISWRDVDTWDFKHPESDDPGAMPGCLYRKEHLAAERIEKLVALFLGVRWTDYMNACGKLKWRKAA